MEAFMAPPVTTALPEPVEAPVVFEMQAQMDVFGEQSAEASWQESSFSTLPIQSDPVPV